jgi:Uma2 family endonuclease
MKRGAGCMVMMLLDETEMSLRDFVSSKLHHDGGWELLKGELVAMSPARAKHELVSVQVPHLFKTILGKHSKCKVYGGNMGLYFWNDDSFVIPDASVVCDQSKFVDGRCVSGPEVVVEVLSPATRKYCLEEKRDLYEEKGVIEYWVVDLDERWVLIENFKSGFKRRFEMGEQLHSDFFENMNVTVDDVFIDLD